MAVLKPRCGCPGTDRRRPWLTTAASGLLLAGGAAGLPVLLLPAAALAALPVLPRAWKALRRLRPDMHLLMLLAAAGAVGLGEQLEAATVLVLFALAQALEAWSAGRARLAVQALMQLAPARALLLEDGRTREIAVQQVKPGDTLLVRPGERIPLDGVLLEGHSFVDQSALTGESLAVEKGPGAELLGGTVNGPGGLTMAALRPAAESLPARTLRLVQQARERRAPAERWVDAFAARYTPLVLLLSLLIALLPPLLLGGPWGRWLYAGLVLLVLACPCALVLSTPVALLAALASAARSGVLIKGGAHLEASAALAAAALDKTGTLTTGTPEVQGLFPLSGHDEAELLSIAAAIEAASEHPLARAIVAHARARGIEPRPATDYQALPGLGATARLEGRPVWIGSPRLLHAKGLAHPELLAALEALSTRGESVVVAGTDAHVCGFLSLIDAPRPGAAEALADLRAAGVSTLVLLTGDHEPAARALATRLGLDEVHAGLLPGEKADAVAALARRHGTAAMVGDGVNDAPALARATLGIALGAGSDAALETADIALMPSDLSLLPYLVRHGRRTLRIVRQNIALSIGVKALFALLALLGTASLWGAIAADMGVSLLVIGNSLRLLRSRGAPRPRPDPRAG